MVIYSNYRLVRNMQKFKQLADPQQHKKYIVNIPKLVRKGGGTGDSLSYKGASLQHPKKQPERRPETTCVDEPKAKLSVRSSKDRTKEVRRQREEVFNKLIARNTVKRMRRFNTQEKECAYERKIDCMKRYVNEMTAKCNSVKKTEEVPTRTVIDQYANEERKKFLMGQISFTQIDEERVTVQRKYLSKFTHLSKSLPKMVQANSEGEAKESEERLIDCLRTIDRIYSMIQEMEDVGYLHKNNRYVIQFCVNGRAWLKKVFLYESGEKKDAFTMLVKYYVIPTTEEAKAKFSEFAARSRGEDMRMIKDDIEGLYDHLEHSLAQKKVMQLMNITNYIESRMREEGKQLSRSLRFTHAEQDKMKLTTDLDLIEEKFGAMREITKISRKRYDQLNRTYEKLQSLPAFE